MEQAASCFIYPFFQVKGKDFIKLTFWEMYLIALSMNAFVLYAAQFLKVKKYSDTLGICRTLNSRLLSLFPSLLIPLKLIVIRKKNPQQQQTHLGAKLRFEVLGSGIKLLLLSVTK